MAEHPNKSKRRLRMLYALKDIQLALSAADFLSECDPEGKISKVELRRFKCYETTAIMAYSRPFTASAGGFPKLSMKMIGVQLDDKQKALHGKVIALRNKVTAHSDVQLMRMVVKHEPIDIGDGKAMSFIATAFDEGLDFLGSDVLELISLLYVVRRGVYTTLLNDAQENPDKFNFCHDWLFPE